MNAYEYVPGPRDRNLDAFDVCRIKRLFSEAIEVAITLSNMYLNRVGPSKIFDVVNQIFPTAYVLNTSYWIYYSSEQGHCLCVCSRYGIPCRHSVNSRHWVDLSPVPEDDYKCINIPKDCFVLLTNYCCDIQVSYQTYDVSIRFTLHHDEEIGEIRGETKDMLIQARYCLARELYVFPDTCVMFYPNPQAMPRYGKLLPNLNNRLGSFNDCLTSNNIPKFTLIVISANVQLMPHCRGPTTVAVPVSCDIFSDRIFLYNMFKKSLKKRYVTKSTQTDEDDVKKLIGRKIDPSVVVKVEAGIKGLNPEEIIDVESVNEEAESRKIKQGDVYLNELMTAFKKPMDAKKMMVQTLDLDTEFEIINEVIEEDLARSESN